MLYFITITITTTLCSASTQLPVTLLYKTMPKFDDFRLVSCVWQFDDFKQPLFYQAPSNQGRKPFPTAAAKGSELCPHQSHWLERTIQNKNRLLSPVRAGVPPTPLQNLFLQRETGAISASVPLQLSLLHPFLTWLLTLLMGKPTQNQSSP